MKISAVIVTRGDIDLAPILSSLHAALCISDIVVWNNSVYQDLSVYGRYAGIEQANEDLIFVQDDDLVLPPSSIEQIAWECDSGGSEYGRLVCNMPQQFRHDFYQEHALVGLGACFHRDLPDRAFRRWMDWRSYIAEWPPPFALLGGDWFGRTCDIVFTALTPRVLVDVPYENLPWASAPNRMWMQKKTHQKERARMLELVLKVREA
jgi:hypothetical protein